jgi:anaerobic ribonucleoside-triphosphate reductase activating protein
VARRLGVSIDPYMTQTLRVATVVADTEAEGPGRRWAAWLQGCPIRCPGCCNPEMFDARGGQLRTVAELGDQVAAAARGGVEGITLLGGEPFAQPVGAAQLARIARDLGLTVMVFSGYTLAELRERDDASDLLEVTDLLVDGRFERDLPEPPPPAGRRWIGSTNQTLQFLTQAYRPDDSRLRAPNTLEIRWSRGALQINGWPIADRLLTRRPR